MARKLILKARKVEFLDSQQQNIWKAVVCDTGGRLAEIKCLQISSINRWDKRATFDSKVAQNLPIW